MRTADFPAYRLMDTSCGEKLERWGDVTLIRPDPQIIWKTPRDPALWKQADARYLRSNSGGGHWENLKNPPTEWTVDWQDLTFRIRPTGFKHTGLFPEQAANWALLRKMISEAGRPIRVLNLFAYTGGATLACASAGAEVCHVDASKGMVAWARENAALSGLSEKPVRWIVDDCGKFIEREIRRGRRYDGIIMDPPSYGRGPGGELWKLEDSIYSLVELAAGVLSDDPLFFLINSYTTGLPPSVMTYLLGTTVGKRFGGKVWGDEIGLLCESTGYALPCGNTAVWQGK
ncbi:MAG: class I SAM-dependent methyltransferase [Oscillospiraceae bacterium]|nr:SAM-dependent methyltransferase [Oscillospiraceae bacterium]MBQ8731202.1 class I SAM-dependent methyltransferase [Oscillospiraceae bacterium]